VALSQSLDIETVAEGIETVEQAKRMEALGCKYGQGYYFARPIEQAAIDKGVAGLTATVLQPRRRRSDGGTEKREPRVARPRAPRLAQSDQTPV